ncbi:PREDICTED: MATH domain and coiled-coil domain-containing protein At3g58360-like [Camelina sativa]|uniref:MATH domain and coiled-coil domain-containing protein At3g58360-like n=1 Tax=Camelina sativa TaxID=90675 RepID=A0ABM1RSE7_CAMSA|nr:PREDICTED: MATH domain and coiled-coil domain-containing protein At3g58360-like [Camelina sativa]
MRLKNPNLRTGYMSLLLSLIETLRQSPNELHKTEIDEAFAALRSMTDAGFKVDWLAKKLVELSEKKQKEEAGGTRISMTDAGFKVDWLAKKLVELSEKKQKEEAGGTRMQEIKDELKSLKQKCLDLEVQLEDTKTEVSAAKAPLSFADVF